MISSATFFRVFAIVVFALIGFTIFPSVVEAQCSMCRASLAGSNANFIRNFNIGVLVLLVPPVAMFCSFFVILRRHKLEDDAEESDK